MREWIKEHASVIFIGLLVLFGILGFTFGFVYSQEGGHWTSRKAIGEFCLQFFGCIIAVALTAVFFNIPDMKNSFARVVSDLFSRGDVARHLTNKGKLHLSKKLIEARISSEDCSVDQALFTHL